MNKTGALPDIVKKKRFQVDSRLICVKKVLIKFKSKNSVLKEDTIIKTWTTGVKTDKFDCISKYTIFYRLKSVQTRHTLEKYI